MARPSPDAGLGDGSDAGARRTRRMPDRATTSLSTWSTVCLAGDGGAIAELSTAVRHKLPLTVVVINDRFCGAEYLK